jgi:hypothetical protein
MLRRVLSSIAPRAAGVRMFTATRPALGVSPFTIFLKQSATNPKLAGLAIGARGKAVGRLYRALPAAELAKLKAVASKTVFRRKIKRAPKKRVPGAWNKFVQANMKKVAKLPVKHRFAALAKLAGKK